MSGGDLFDYQENKIYGMIDLLEEFIKNESAELSEHMMKEFKTGLKYLNLAYVYAHRIDYLVSCDDSEESFHRRLKEDLTCIGCCSEISKSKCHSCGAMNLVQITEESE